MLIRHASPHVSGVIEDFLRVHLHMPFPRKESLITGALHILRPKGFGLGFFDGVEFTDPGLVAGSAHKLALGSVTGRIPNRGPGVQHGPARDTDGRRE